MRFFTLCGNQNLNAMQTVQKQTFNFTDKSNQKEYRNWKNALKVIPLPKKKYWLENLESLCKEEKAVIAIKATYEFLDIDDNTWFWLSILFFKNGTAKTEYLCNYAGGEEDALLPVVNAELKVMGFKTVENLDTWPNREMKTWQEGYDLLCNIARTRKVPSGKFKKTKN